MISKTPREQERNVFYCWLRRSWSEGANYWLIFAVLANIILHVFRAFTRTHENVDGNLVPCGAFFVRIFIERELENEKLVIHSSHALKILSFLPAPKNMCIEPSKRKGGAEKTLSFGIVFFRLKATCSATTMFDELSSTDWTNSRTKWLVREGEKSRRFVY